MPSHAKHLASNIWLKSSASSSSFLHKLICELYALGDGHQSNVPCAEDALLSVVVPVLIRSFY
jgi:hypothetical protein